MSSYDVVVKIIADGKKAVAEFDRAGKAADRMAKKTHDDVEKSRISMEKFGRQAGIAGAAMVGAAGTVAFAMKGWVDAAEHAERAHMQLVSSIKGAYGASSQSVRGFEEQAKAIQKVTVASDEDVMSIQAMLIQFGLTQRQVRTLTPLVVDIARKWGIDYTSAAKAVEKAASGKTTALKKLGIQVDETKAKTDPYIATVDALRKAAGGFAEQEGKTFAGQTAILGHQMDDLKESLGRGVLSVLNDLMPAVNDVAGAFTTLDDKTGGLIGRSVALGAGFTGVLGSALLVTSAVIKMHDAYENASNQTGVFGAVAGELPAIGVAIASAFGVQQLIQWAAGVKQASAAADQFTSTASGMGGAHKSFMQEFEASQRGQAASFSGFFKGLYSMALRAPAPTLPDSWGGAFQKQGRALGKQIQDGIAREGYDKAFTKMLALNPQLGRDLLQYAETHASFKAKIEASGASLHKWRKELEAIYDTNKNGRVEGIEKVMFRADSLKDVHTYIDAVNGAYDAQTNFAKATLAVKDAQNGVKDAEKNLAEARKDGDKGKIADAQSQLASAYMGVADANHQVQDAAIKNAEAQLDLQNLISDPKKFKESIDHWGDLVKVMGKDSPVAKAIQSRIDDWVLMAYTTGQPLQLDDATVLTALADLHSQGKISADQLNALNAKWNAGHLDTSGVTGPLGALSGALDAFMLRWNTYWGAGTGPLGPTFVLPGTNPPPASPPIPTMGPAPAKRFVSHARASGGPVAGSMPYLVGEKGPELFVPTGNGMIVPNGNLSAMRATGTGAVVNINVAAGPLATPAETGAAVLDALKAYERRNGALPLKVA